MKKIIYTIIAIFTMVACTDDHLIDIPTPPTEENGEKVEIKFSVQIPEAKAVDSRTFTTPAIDNLYLVVFDANGYLSEVAEAAPVSSFGLGTKDAPIEFTVTLSQTPNKRTVHFIAYDEIIPDGETADPLTTALEAMKSGDLFGHESTLMTEELMASGQQDVYWQRVEFTEGITTNTIDDMMTPIPLIRNFAKITVALNQTEAGATSITVPVGYQFTLEGFMVVNTLNAGSVAPYNTNGGGFVNYVDADNEPYPYSDLNGTYGYTGFVPNGTDFSDVDIDEPTDGAASPYTTAAKYMYERNGQSQNTNRTFVIMKGKFGPTNATDTQSTYYKIDLTNASGDYYEILRNFSYNIVIKGVDAEGKSSPSEAAGMTGSHNNLSTSIETQSLLNISDGVSRLFVNYTEYVFVTDNETMELKYRYVPNISSPDTESNDDIKVEWTAVADGSGAISSIESPVDDEGNAIGDDDAGWRTLVVTAGTVDALQTKEQTVTLTDGNNVSRMVIFKLRPKFNFSNEKATSPDPASTLKATFTYSFSIPFGSAESPNIPESLFPLTFIVQATPENIYPNADENSLPVHVLNGEQTFGYERVVTWEEYLNEKGNIKCYFRVNTTNYQGTKITVSNPYFNNCRPVTLQDGTVITLTDNDGTVDGILTWDVGDTSAQTATVTITPSTVGLSALPTLTYFNVSLSGNTLTIKPKENVSDGTSEKLVVTTTDGEEDELTLKVESIPLQVTDASLSPTTVELGSGKTVTLTFTMNKKATLTINTQRLTGASSSTGTVTLNDGTISYTPTASGTQTITFTTADAVRGGTVTISHEDIIPISLTYGRSSWGNRNVNNGDSDYVGNYIIKVGTTEIGSCSYEWSGGFLGLGSYSRLTNITFNDTYTGTLTNDTEITITNENETYTINTTIGNLINASNLSF